MTSESLPESADDFFRIAEELVMLTKDEALIVAEAVKKSGQSPEQVALQKGFLDAAQVDIIETLLHPRDTVPGYEILDVLGQGGMGVVYRARQLNLNRIVALKAILLSRMSDKSAAGRFAQEAETVGKLRHPNIVAAYDFGRHEGRLFLAMELVEGEDVDSLLQDEGRLDEPTAWGIARQAASGLAHANRLGVVHRDIKPANLLLVEPPEGFPLPPNLPMVKITDFGLAFLADDQQAHTRLTSDNSAVGSPHYMAPEQLTDSEVDFRADIYALGATVYHMLAGRPPFGGLNLSQIIAQKLSGDMKRLSERCPDVSPASCRLVERMLARNPEDRPGDYRTLIAEIEQLGAAIEKTSSMLPVVPSTGSEGMITDVVSTNDTQIMPSGPRSAAGESPSPALAPSGISRKRAAVLFGMAAAGFLAAGFLAWWFRSTSTAAALPQPVAMQSSGWRTSLFNPQSQFLDDWIKGHGNWLPGEDAEGARVIHGTDGQIGKALFKKDGGALEYYRLELHVNPQEATAVEFHFGLQPVETRDGARYVVRFDETGLTLGERASDAAAIDPIVEKRPSPPPFVGDHMVLIERQPTGWFVTVDELELVGLARRAQGELPEFRMVAEGGPAWFFDPSVEELEPIVDPAASNAD